MKRDLQGSVVVLTGASSGVGRAAAHAFAREGARLVLAARALEPLERVGAECRALGADVRVLSTDVRDEAAVRRLAACALEGFGAIDTWVNGAGVIAYGPFDAIPSDVFRAVIETNLMGQVHGARAALAQFRRQGQGVIINLCSVWGRVTSPQVSAYVTSKFAVRAFSECLRQELRDLPRIDVATILPQAVDTPIFDRAANYAGRRVRPLPPLLDPRTVADGIVRCARSPKREVTYARSGRLLELLQTVTPRLYQRVMPPVFVAGSFGSPTAPPGSGATLQAGAADHAVSGHWRSERRASLVASMTAAAGGLLRGALGRSR
jgi:NAD(P)-dependent dehydrogenase (short-subunit alcohol dehydrogenase family)